MQNSYYFAHAPRNTGEAPAPPPVHQPLEVLKVDAPAEVYEVLASGYQFLDEGGKTVKVREGSDLDVAWKLDHGTAAGIPGAWVAFGGAMIAWWQAPFNNSAAACGEILLVSLLLKTMTLGGIADAEADNAMFERPEVAVKQVV
jgi:hypothetical protein